MWFPLWVAPEHQLYTTRNANTTNGYLNWSPDGKALAFSEGGADSFSFRSHCFLWRI